MKLPRYLYVSLLLTAAAVGYTMFLGDGDVADAPQPVVRPARAPTLPTAPAPAGASPTATPNAVDLFPNQGRLEEPPVQALVLPAPAAPSTPPLPFRFIGVWWEDGERQLVLAVHDRIFIVCRVCGATDKLALGDTVANLYRLDKIDDRQLTFTYLPTQAQQTLSLGETVEKPGF